ncbi:MAG: arginase [Flavobacteriales bacterium]
MKVCERVCENVSEALQNKQFPLVLAGDHSTAHGTIAGIKKSDPEKKVGVVWIDAHADLNTPYTSPSGNIHGMSLAATLCLDNIKHADYDSDEETYYKWKQLQKIGGNYPAEEKFIEENNIKNFPVNEIREKGGNKLSDEILNSLKHCDLIYLSFDVDSLDPNISSGTGTPVENGLQVEETKQLITSLLQNEKICCFEVVEVNPTLDDKKNKMADEAFGILEKACEVVGSDSYDRIQNEV